MDHNSATWYLIKYVHDLRRWEPANVGVVLHSRHGWCAKFVGENAPGEISGRLPHNLRRTSYLDWLAYFRRSIGDDTWSQVFEHQERRAVNFYAERGGVILDDIGDPETTLDNLFLELVLPEGTRSPGVHDESAVRVAMRQLFERVQIQPETQPSVDGRWAPDGPLTKIEFDFGYQNGRYHLMSALDTKRQHELHSTALNAQITAAGRSGAANNFLVFYSTEILGEDRLDDVLSPIEKLALTIDVDSLDDAESQLADLFVH